MTQSKQTRFFSLSTQTTCRNRSEFSIVLYQLTFMCQTLCAASTARGLAIMKTFARRFGICLCELRCWRSRPPYLSLQEQAKCVNCGKEHVSRSNQCEIWKKEKEIMKIKTTKNITYLEAKTLFDSQSTDLDFSKIVHSLSSKPETKTTGTQFFEDDFIIHSNTRVPPSVKISGPKTPSVSHSNVQSNKNARPRANSAARPHSQSSSQSSSQSGS